MYTENMYAYTYVCKYLYTYLDVYIYIYIYIIRDDVQLAQLVRAQDC